MSFEQALSFKQCLTYTSTIYWAFGWEWTPQAETLNTWSLVSGAVCRSSGCFLLEKHHWGAGFESIQPHLTFSSLSASCSWDHASPGTISQNKSCTLWVALVMVFWNSNKRVTNISFVWILVFLIYRLLLGIYISWLTYLSFLYTAWENELCKREAL